MKKPTAGHTFQEGSFNKGGLNSPPTAPRPNIAPAPQHPAIRDGLTSAVCMSCGSKAITVKIDQLNAAAPELLEVAKWAESVLTSETGFSDTRLAKIRAAIAKAEVGS